MRELFRTINSPLARRVGIYVILLSTLLSVFTSGLQIYSEFKREKNGVLDVLQQIEKTHLTNIAARVWVLDSTELKRSIVNLLELSSIRHAKVIEDGKTLISVGEDVGENLIVRKFPLIYKNSGTNNEVGRLVVKASMDDVYQRVFDRVTLIIASNLVKTLIVAFFILYIFYMFVTRHLSEISTFLSNEKPVSDTQVLSLKRKYKKNDELDLLVDSINKMKINLKEQFEEINWQRQDLAQTLNSIGDAVITTDSKGKVTRMNPVAERLTGMLNGDALGQEINSVFPIVDASTNKEMQNPIDKVMSSGEIVHLSNHTTLLSKTGEQYQISDSAAPIKDDDGNILGMVLVFNDISEQYELRRQAKLNEKKYRTLARVAPVGIFYADISGRCLYINEKWSEITGMSLCDAMGEGWIKAIYSEDVKNIYTAWREFIKKGVPFKFEYRFQQGENIIWVLSEALAEEDTKGNIIGYVGTITDITERKKIEEALNRSQKMEALGKLTGGIAHDYNNMLSIILGYTELLEIELKEESTLNEYVHEIYEAGSRGAKLTSKLLGFSRQSASHSEVVDLNRILKGEQNMLEKTLTASIKLRLDLMDDLWAINVDNSDLENAVINLCINASHAMQGSGELIIKTSNTYVNEEKYVCLSISDNGCGIPEKEQEKIFDPFYSTKGEAGTGLGLSQVYGFTERSAGIINVDSELGKGTVFTILFPYYNEDDINKTELDKGNKIIDNQRGDEVVLVVDDEISLLKLCAEILESNGYRTFTADSGEKALEILEIESIDLLLSDVIMPGMSGYELATIVQKKYPAIKIQMASGFTGDSEENNRDDDLFNNLLRKPYHMDVLLKKVRALLD